MAETIKQQAQWYKMEDEIVRWRGTMRTDVEMTQTYDVNPYEEFS